MGLPVLESLLNDNGTAFADGTDLPPVSVAGFWARPNSRSLGT